MQNLSQYFMLVHTLVLVPLLFAATALLFKRLRGVSTLIMVVGAGVMIGGGWYSAAWVGLSGDMSQSSQTEVMNVHAHLTIGSLIATVGLIAFVVGFILFTLHITRRQAI
jgi:hypothetical protein